MLVVLHRHIFSWLVVVLYNDFVAEFVFVTSLYI
jgi:hypothetical protein